jgi:hypothetical protein
VDFLQKRFVQLPVGSSGVLVFESVPAPAWDAEALPRISGRLVITGHRRFPGTHLCPPSPTRLIPHTYTGAGGQTESTAAGLCLTEIASQAG